MKVKALKKLLEGLNDDALVTVEVSSLSGNQAAGFNVRKSIHHDEAIPNRLTLDLVPEQTGCKWIGVFFGKP